MKLFVTTVIALALTYSLLIANAYAEFPVTNEKMFKDAEVTRDLQLARSHWGKLPSCVETYMADINGYWAWTAGCSIWLDRTDWASRNETDNCETVVHEVGHALGHPHSDDPSNIMFPGSLTRSIPQCEPGYVLIQPKKKRCHSWTKQQRRQRTRCRTAMGEPQR